MPEQRRAASDDAWGAIERLIDRALDLEPGKRRAFLSSLDTEQRLVVESALGDITDPAADPGMLAGEVSELIEGIAPSTAVVGSAEGEDAAAHTDPVGVGERIGPYRVLRRLGRGGMGEVLLAERADGLFEQRVAIKVLRVAIPESEGRFQRERQILARLNHPGITGLLDGGLTDDGVPYLVMEYVDGVSITEYCERHTLSVEERLGLFCQMCRAVEFAHRNLVVHRDLKPGNVLVTDEGQVKLLDFGIAKLLGQRSGFSTVHGERQFLTPQYAAPEQVLGRPITTAADIYGLGLVLYELLTGRRPYDLGGHPVNAARVLLEKRLRPPSDAIRRIAPESGEVAVIRGLPAQELRTGGLSRRLRGDLDAIVLKALEKEPEDRYESVRALRQDVERHLEDLPVRAVGRDVVARAAKFVRRQRISILGSLLLLVTALGVLGVVAWRRQVERQDLRILEQAERSSFEANVAAVRRWLAADPAWAADEEAMRRRVESLVDDEPVPAIEAALRAAAATALVEWELWPLAAEQLDRVEGLGSRVELPDALISRASFLRRQLPDGAAASPRAADVPPRP